MPGAENTTPPGPGAVKLSELRTVRRLNALINTMLGARDKAIIATFSHLVVRLPAKDYGTIEFDMTDTRREMLVAAGRQFMAAYLDGLETPTTLMRPKAPATPEEIANLVAQELLEASQ